MRLIKYFIPILMSASSVLLKAEPFKLGLESIPAAFIQNLLKLSEGGARVGLITNQTGKDQQGIRNLDLLVRQGVRVTKIFAPEHGFSGHVDAAHEVKNGKDVATGIDIVSLYGAGTGRTISAEHVGDVDVLVFDIQDSGMRHYTYISTLLHAMQAASEHNKKFVVLDRPNPLGWHMEGPLVDPAIQNVKSFIAAAPIPLRHGMTIGEIAWFYNKHVLEKPAMLHVVKMQNYDRRHGLSVCPMVALSPNLQTVQACHGYSFLGLLGEIRPFDVGVKTDKAFQTIMLPEQSFKHHQWEKLQPLLAGFGVKTSPIVSREKGKKAQKYHGFHIEIEDINKTSSFNLLISMLQFFKAEGIELNFSNFFDRAIGTDLVRDHLVKGENPVMFADKINNDLDGFYAKAIDCFMYEPLPKVVRTELLSK
jgi:uncharacterized protein YbbC (DUF1343 family)